MFKSSVLRDSFYTRNDDAPYVPIPARFFCLGDLCLPGNDPRVSSQPGHQPGLRFSPSTKIVAAGAELYCRVPGLDQPRIRRFRDLWCHKGNADVNQGEAVWTRRLLSLRVCHVLLVIGAGSMRPLKAV